MAPPGLTGERLVIAGLGLPAPTPSAPTTESTTHD
jgi:hypothetical protein